MNKFIIQMSQNQSEISEHSDFIIKLQNCLLKALKSSERLISSQLIQKVQSKIQQITSMNSMIETVQYFFFVFINTIETMRQSVSVDVEKEDYEHLQGAVQKAEAEIRKHIRLEQQLKIYMDGLEEKIQQLERELKVESEKYHQLFESMKTIDLQRRQLKKKLKQQQSRQMPSQQKDLKYLNHKTSKILSEPSAYENQGSGYQAYKMYQQRNRLAKSKNFLDKSINNKQQLNAEKKKNIDEYIQVSIPVSPNSRKRNQSEKVELKEMTRTIQLKQNYRKPSRKVLKYSTDQKGGVGKKTQNRSNSVCY